MGAVVEHPQFATDVGTPATAAWLRDTFEPDARARRFPDPATWSALRTRGLLWGPPSRLVTKIACFTFPRGSEEPDLVVKAMPERRFTERLRHEIEAVEAIRRRVPAGGPVAAARPLAPPVADTVAGDDVVVQRLDPLAAATGSATPSIASRSSP